MQLCITGLKLNANLITRTGELAKRRVLKVHENTVVLILENMTILVREGESLLESAFGEGWCLISRVLQSDLICKCVRIDERKS